MKVIKRDGREVDFEISKIINAVSKANKEVEDIHQLSDVQIKAVADDIADSIEASNHAANVEDIQDLVETGIMKMRGYEVARKYVKYRYKHELARKNKGLYNKILTIVGRTNEAVIQENANKNPIINSTQRDYIAGETSKAITDDLLLPPHINEAHNNGLIHIHDKDYFIQPMHNCCVFNLDDMLQNGTVISETMIEKPKSLRTAATVTSQIVAQIASNSYGGQTWTLSHLAPFVDVSRQKYRKEVREELEAAFADKSLVTDKMIESIAENRVKKEVKDSIQTLQYQLLTLLTTNGQTPFVSIMMYINEVPAGQLRTDLVMLIEEMLKQRILGVKDRSGAYITIAFPKLIYVLTENNTYEGSEYFWLTELSAKCSAKRLVPDYISEKIMLEQRHTVYAPMGCRSFLGEDKTGDGYGNVARAKNYDPNKPKYYGRFNCGVVTLNLPDVALSSGKDLDKFWSLLDERCELCREANMIRFNKLKGTPSDVAPILWQHGALARLEPGETIDKLLYNGYATISLGYTGLFETVKYMTGYSHTNSEVGKEFGLEVMRFLNKKIEEWKERDNIGWALYGTPQENITEKFAKCLQKRFGIIEGITDKNYVVNSYHTDITEDINAFDKISKEAEFQYLSGGGCITYVETPDMKNNIPAVISIMQHIYEKIMYAEINTQSSHCRNCGYDGFMDIIQNKDGKLIWRCPQCSTTDKKNLVIRLRVCGYISSNDMCQGRMADVMNRKMHI